MYYIGDWEIGAMQEKYDAGEVDYFYMPTTKDSVTAANEFCVNSGIGMAFNAETFDEKTKEFLLYVLDHYADIYTKKCRCLQLKRSCQKMSIIQVYI